MEKKDFNKFMNNLNSDQRETLNAISTMLIEMMADKNPKAMLLKVYDDLCSSEYGIMDKVMDSKETEKVERTIEIVKQVTAILKDFEKEVF